MVVLEELSPVGVGMYRMSVDSEEHFAALKTAITSGYNLLDTATNYSNGKSEELIGRFIEAYPEHKKQLFIISKVGYIPSRSLQKKAFSTFLTEHVSEIAVIEDDFEYSLDPNFISYQLDNSLERLNRDYLDVYLLHNPERYLQSQNLNSPATLYEAVKLAFEKLEEKVNEGKIRYYGVSSNLIFDPTKEGSIDCRQLLEIAKSIKEDHHFKFLQFPFNFKEKMALQPNYGEESLLEFTKNNGLIRIANRPLNMNQDGFEFCLVTHEEALKELDVVAAKTCLSTFCEQVDKQIAKLTNSESKASDFEPISALEKHYASFQSKSAVDAFFRQGLAPFVQTVFEEDSHLITPLMNELQQHLCLFALQNQTNKTNQFLTNLKVEGVVIKENSVLTACHSYFNQFSLDHVLIGLRKPSYVFALNNRFKAPPHSIDTIN